MYFEKRVSENNDDFYYLGTLDNQIVPQGRYGIHRDLLASQYSSQTQNILLATFISKTKDFRDNLGDIFLDDSGTPYAYKFEKVATFGAIQYANEIPILNTTFTDPKIITAALSTHSPITDQDVGTSTYVNFITHHTTARPETFDQPKYSFIDNILSQINILKTFLGINSKRDDAITKDLVDKYTQATFENIKEYNKIFENYENYNRAIRRLLFILYDNKNINPRFLVLFNKLIEDFENNEDTKFIFRNYSRDVASRDVASRDVASKDINIATYKNPDGSWNPTSKDLLLNNDYISNPELKNFSEIDKSCMSDFIYSSSDPEIIQAEIEATRMYLLKKQQREYIEILVTGGGSRSKTRQKRNQRRNTKKRYNKLRKGKRTNKKKHNRRRTKKRQ